VTKLFAISDGPNPDKQGDILKVNECRKLISELRNIEKIVCLYREVNIGIYKNITEGVEFVFSQTDKCIFLEDDELPDLTFFRFCDEMLTKYENNKKIMMIQGAPTMMPTIMKRITQDSYFFSSYPSMAWGWAAWRDRWMQHYDGELKNWPLDTQQQIFMRSIVSRREYRFWARKWDWVKLTKHTWDYQVMFAFFSQALLAVVPKDNLVRNIGFNRLDATHTSGPSHWERLPLQQCTFPLRHPITPTENFKYDKLRKNYVAPSIRRRAIQKLTRLMNSVQVKTMLFAKCTIKIGVCPSI
jgi:hypothetical protein